jgi:hypothetical protein
VGKHLSRTQHFNRQLHIYGTAELIRAVDKCAFLDGVTTSAWVRAAIVAALDAKGIVAPPLPTDYASPKRSRMLHRAEDRVVAAA